VRPQTRSDLVDGLAVGADRDSSHVELFSGYGRHGCAVVRVGARREVAGVRTEVVFDHLQNHVVGPARLA